MTQPFTCHTNIMEILYFSGRLHSHDSEPKFQPHISTMQNVVKC